MTAQTEEAMQGAPESAQTEGAQTEGAQTEGAQDAPEGAGEHGDAHGKANREAARYRTRLREVEAERDRLAEQVEALQRQAIERLVVEVHRGKPAGLWASGVTVADLVNADGTVDPDKVRDAWRKAADELGLATRDGAYVPAEGRNAEWRTSGTSWQEALQRR